MFFIGVLVGAFCGAAVGALAMGIAVASKGDRPLPATMSHERERITG